MDEPQLFLRERPVTLNIAPNPSQNGTGTINVHFTAQCAYTKPDGTLWLEIKSIMSDNPHLGSLTQESCPVDCGYLAMPPNPSTTSGPERGTHLIFPNLAILSSEGAFTVTSGALKIGSDVPNKAAFIVGDPAFSAAGKPDGCVVATRTFKTTRPRSDSGAIGRVDGTVTVALGGRA